MNELSRSQYDDQQNTSDLYQQDKPMFDLPKLFLFDKEEYETFVNEYLRERNDKTDANAIYYSQLNIGLSYKDIDTLYNDNSMTQSMMIFMLNYLYNEEALRGDAKPKVFFQPIRIHHAKKQLFDLYEEWSQYLKVKDFNPKNHKYLCEIMHINKRWVLIIINLRRKSAVIVDFKYNDAFPLIDILNIFNNITEKTYGINLSTFAVEGVLFTASESTDSGYYIISYLSKLIQGYAFDKIKFSAKEKSLLKLNYLWLIFKLKTLKPSFPLQQIDSVYETTSRNASRLMSQSSFRSQQLQTDIPLQYMQKIIIQLYSFIHKLQNISFNIINLQNPSQYPFKN